MIWHRGMPFQRRKNKKIILVTPKSISTLRLTLLFLAIVCGSDIDYLYVLYILRRNSIFYPIEIEVNAFLRPVLLFEMS